MKSIVTISIFLHEIWLIMFFSPYLNVEQYENLKPTKNPFTAHVMTFTDGMQNQDPISDVRNRVHDPNRITYHCIF